MKKLRIVFVKIHFLCRLWKLVKISEGYNGVRKPKYKARLENPFNGNIIMDGDEAKWPVCLTPALFNGKEIELKNPGEPLNEINLTL